MKCRFCNSEMKTTYFHSEINSCNNHKTIKVRFKTNKYGDRWIVSNNNYRLVYWSDRTLLQKYNPNADSPLNTYELVKKFDFEPNFSPEEFNEKLKTILVFL